MAVEVSSKKTRAPRKSSKEATAASDSASAQSKPSATVRGAAKAPESTANSVSSKAKVTVDRKRKGDAVRVVPSNQSSRANSADSSILEAIAAKRADQASSTPPKTDANVFPSRTAKASAVSGFNASKASATAEKLAPSSTLAYSSTMTSNGMGTFGASRPAGFAKHLTYKGASRRYSTVNLQSTHCLSVVANRRRIVAILTGLPIAIVTSYFLWQRIAEGKEPIKLPRLSQEKAAHEDG